MDEATILFNVLRIFFVLYSLVFFFLLQAVVDEVSDDRLNDGSEHEAQASSCPRVQRLKHLMHDVTTQSNLSNIHVAWHTIYVDVTGLDGHVLKLS